MLLYAMVWDSWVNFDWKEFLYHAIAWIYFVPWHTGLKLYGKEIFNIRHGMKKCTSWPTINFHTKTTLVVSFSYHNIKVSFLHEHNPFLSPQTPFFSQNFIVLSQTLQISSPIFIKSTSLIII